MEKVTSTRIYLHQYCIFPGLIYILKLMIYRQTYLPALILHQPHIYSPLKILIAFTPINTSSTPLKIQIYPYTYSPELIFHLPPHWFTHSKYLSIPHALTPPNIESTLHLFYPSNFWFTPSNYWFTLQIMHSPRQVVYHLTKSFVSRRSRFWS